MVSSPLTIWGMSGRQELHPHLISIISTAFSAPLIIWGMSGRQELHPHLISIISNAFSPPLVIWGMSERQGFHPHLISIISNAFSPSPDIMRHMQTAGTQALSYIYRYGSFLMQTLLPLCIIISTQSSRSSILPWM